MKFDQNVKLSHLKEITHSQKTRIRLTLRQKKDYNLVSFNCFTFFNQGIK